MKILLCNLFISLTSDTIQKYLKKLGHSCIQKNFYTPDDLYEDDKIDWMLAKEIKLTKPDAVFTVNFWPPVARVCNKANIKYISYGYDSPQNIPKTDDMEYETNFIFLFDRDETEKYRRQGIERVYHAPLATDIDLWDKARKLSGKSYDISLVGKIYESTFPGLLAGMDEYHKGFFKAIIAAQQKVYGYYMIDDLVADKMDELNRQFKRRGAETEVSLNQLSYSVGSYITYLDRLTILRLMQTAGETHLFTEGLSEPVKDILKGVNTHGRVSYEQEMPAVFKSTKVNLNPVLRVIRTGVPQRALDVMGCGAFLLSSFQPELAEYFLSGEELALYDSYEDAVDKAAFYIRNDSERERVQKNGYERIKQFFTYEVRLSEMLETVGME